MSSPDLLPKKQRGVRRVFLEPEFWEELTEVAQFHSMVFKEMGSKEKVSRNDVIGAFLRWAVDTYWNDKGGKPTETKDRLEKARRHAEKLKKQGGRL